MILFNILGKPDYAHKLRLDIKADRLGNAGNFLFRIATLRKLSIDNGMVPLWNSCRAQVLNGNTSIQELMTLNLE